MVDLSLPTNTSVGLLMPPIVDIVCGGTPPTDTQRWRLSRIGGPVLDDSMTLDQNDIRDGELLVLTSDDLRAPEWAVDDDARILAGLVNATHAPAARGITTATCLSAAGFSVAALIWSGHVTGAASHLVTSGVITAVAAIGAVTVRRSDADRLLCATLNVIAVVFGSGTGLLAVPGGPGAANYFLAATTSVTMSLLLLRITRRGTTCLTAIAAAGAAIAAAAGGTMWTLTIEAAGAAAMTLSLAVLAGAARLALAIAGLSPVYEDEVDPHPSELREAQSGLAHRTMTGLVCGASASAAVGAVLVARGVLGSHGFWLNAATFGVIVGFVLLMRSFTHIDLHRRLSLVAGGLVCAAAGLTVVVVSAPGHANWVSAAAAAAGLASLGWRAGMSVSPVVHRAVEILEYVALCAVVPLACWVGGLYGLIRGTSLT